VLPTLSFGDSAGTVRSRVLFIASVPAAFSLAQVQLLSAGAPFSQLQSADDPLIVDKGVVLSTGAALAPNATTVVDGPRRLRRAVVAGLIAGGCAVLLLLILALACAAGLLRPRSMLRRLRCATSAHAKALPDPATHPGRQAADGPGLRRAQPFASMAPLSADSWAAALAQDSLGGRGLHPKPPCCRSTPSHSNVAAPMDTVARRMTGPPAVDEEASPMKRRLTRTGSRVLAEDIEMLELLGSGGEGAVYKARWQGTVVAVKRWHGACMTQAMQAQVRSESDFLRQLRHPGIINYYGVCLSPPCLVMEYAEGGSLAQLIHGGEPQAPRGLPLPRLLQLAEDIASALDYLHSVQVVHKDLKPANVLLGASGAASLSDFGISKWLQGDYLTTSNLGAGTIAYQGPELHSGVGVTERCDQYSLGVLLWEMLTGCKPWAGRNVCDIILRVGVDRERPPMPQAGCPAALRRLICDLWQHEPGQRGSALEARHRIVELRFEEGLAAAAGDG
jgi:tRNA A-37 threonylcarbamoyl transferase component Bud32